MVHKNKKNSNKLKFLLIGVAVILISGIGIYFVLHNKSDKKNDTNTLQNNRNEAKINLEPATEDDKQDSDKLKETIVENQQTPPPNSKTVTPIVVYAGYNKTSSLVEVDAIVPEIIETTGECKLLLTSGDRTVTKTVTGVANAQNTTCPSFAVPKSELSTGTWNVVVAYSSATHSGSSINKTSVEIE